jgi:hypothetical protein
LASSVIIIGYGRTKEPANRILFCSLGTALGMKALRLVRQHRPIWPLPVRGDKPIDTTIVSRGHADSRLLTKKV